MKTTRTSILAAILLTLAGASNVWALGSAAQYDHTAFATAEQGVKADNAIPKIADPVPGDLVIQVADGTLEKGGTVADKLAAETPYPMLRFELAGAYTEFALKATTNNFASLVYYHKSWEAAEVAGDNSPKVFFVDSSRPDPRLLLLATNNVSIVSQLTNPANGVVSTALLSPSTNTVVAASAWMNPHNQKLTWMYARATVGGIEQDGQGRIIWRPIEPIKWMKSQRTEP